MPKQALISLVKSNRPLVEVGISLVEGFNAETILDELNELADDFEASLSPYCKLTGDKNLLIVDATPEALRRIFGWEIKRVLAKKWNYETRQFEGIWDNFYIWEETNKPTMFPSCLEGKVTGIGLSQPGTNDNGEQDYP